MKTQDIKNMASAYMQVQEKAKMDPVNKDELKGTHAQRKDKDINNDGKVDSTDKYLHARRKAISSKQSETETVEAKDYGPGHIGAVQKMLDKEREAKKAKDAMKKEEVSEAAPKMKGDFIKMQRQKDAEHAAAMGRSVKTGRKLPTKTMTSTQRSLASMRKEDTKWPIYDRIMEKRDQHVKGATPPEPMDSKFSGKDQEFVRAHGGLTGTDSGIDGAKAAEFTAKSATSTVNVAPGRPNDNKMGDKKPIDSTKA